MKLVVAAGCLVLLQATVILARSADEWKSRVIYQVNKYKIGCPVLWLAKLDHKVGGGKPCI